MAELWDVMDEDGNKTGRLHKRGEPMKKGEYHLTVYVWIVNSKGELLISKRSPNKPFPDVWECTGGNAVAGDDSLTTAIKETEEELGIALNPDNGTLLKRHKLCSEYGGQHADIWIFHQDVDILSVVLQPNETCDAMWATKEQINQMIEEKTFITWDIFTNIDELF